MTLNHIPDADLELQVRILGAQRDYLVERYVDSRLEDFANEREGYFTSDELEERRKKVLDGIAAILMNIAEVEMLTDEYVKCPRCGEFGRPFNFCGDVGFTHSDDAQDKRCDFNEKIPVPEQVDE